jgi:hypothetical protein
MLIIINIDKDIVNAMNYQNSNRSTLSQFQIYRINILGLQEIGLNRSIVSKIFF